MCVLDTILQTGGAEWFVVQLALAANPGVFEFVFATWRSRDSDLARFLRERGVKVSCATSERGVDLAYSEWTERQVFVQLDRMQPDIVLFASQYLFQELNHERLSRFCVVVRISNFHGDDLAAVDFSAVDAVICCSTEQHQLLGRAMPEKTPLIHTGVDTETFRPSTDDEKRELRRTHAVSGKSVVLFVGRLSDPLKRVELFQDVVREVRAFRDDVAFLVVGYFERHRRADEEAFRAFARDHQVVWVDNVNPWEAARFFQVADVLLSTSDVHEGLSNTVLQALSSGVVPVVTGSSGMEELVVPGETGFVVPTADASVVAREVLRVVDMDASERRTLAEAGRRRVTSRFSFNDSALEYQRSLLATYRRRPATVGVTDGYFGIGGAEWLAAQLMATARPDELQFHLLVHRRGSALVDWVDKRGVVVHEDTASSYTEWRNDGVKKALLRARPNIVMPCTVTTWPSHDPFYRLLVISQNASDAEVLTEAHYEEADYFLCVSDDVKQRLDARYHWKMTVLRNSIDVEMFRRDLTQRSRVRDALGIAPDAMVVLWCGRMHERRKRLDVLMDVIDEMKRERKVHFLVLGYFRGDEGDQDGWRDFLVSHPNVSWVEGAAPWETPAYYAAADVYLSTSAFTRSDFEGLSVATVQALAAELPVVTTLSGGQQEIVDEGVNGRLVEPGDVAALAEALREYATSDAKARAAIGRRGREKARESFDIREHGRTYTALARLMKNTVGSALATDPELAVEPFAFDDIEHATDRDVARASAFLAHTWPLLPRAVEHRLPNTGVGGDVVVAADEHLHTNLTRAEATLRGGASVVIDGLGFRAADEEPRAKTYSARAICALLDFLDQSFPLWAACERDGRDVVLRKVADRKLAAGAGRR